MIGNDIVDLNLAKIQSNWRRKGFLNKIFTEDEQTLIRNSANPFQLVWLFWSMKESAYKIDVQKYQYRFFAPKRLRCELISETQGMVVVNNERYYTSSKITSNYIFTEAVEDNNKVITHACFALNSSLYPIQSYSVYNRVRKSISEKRAVSINTLKIRKNSAGVPKLYKNNKQLNVSFSISHHGSYGAYSVLNTSK